MHLVFKQPHLSISAMNDVHLPAFAVVIGRNGVGKTQLLDAIAQDHISVSGIPQSEIVKYDINTFKPQDATQAAWGNCLFAERTAEHYFSGRPGKVPFEIAEEVFSNTLQALNIADDPTARAEFEHALRQQVRQLPDFKCFHKFGGVEAVVSYSAEILRKVIEPLKSQKPRERSKTASPTCGGDSAILLSLSMKLTGKLPHELERDDILHAAYYEGDTIANKLSQAFARYKVEQYSWAYTQSQAGKDTVQNLLALYRRSRTPPWVLLRENLDQLRKESDDPQLFDFEFSDPETDELVFAVHTQYSFKAVFRNRTTGASYSLSSLSSGEKILMALYLAAFNQRMGQGRPRLLLFDELDAVLHPSMISSLIRGLKSQFVDQGTQVIMATHSITTVSLLEDGEIYRLVRDGSRVDIQPAAKSEAVSELSEGLATIDTGLKVIASKRSAPIMILTEGHNALHLKKWASLFFPSQVDVFEGLPTKTGKDQLLTYGQFLAKVTANSHFLIVWDCDAKSKATQLASELPEAANVTAFAFDQRENTIAPKGIENKYEEGILTPYSNKVVDNKDVELRRSLDSKKKTDFARYVFEKGTREDFAHFGDLHTTVTRILSRAGIDRVQCETS